MNWIGAIILAILAYCAGLGTDTSKWGEAALKDPRKPKRPS